MNKYLIAAALFGTALAACETTPPPSAEIVLPPHPDGADPQIHHSNRPGVQGPFELGVFFCRNALTEVQRGRGLQRGLPATLHAAEFGFGDGPTVGPRHDAAGPGEKRVFGARGEPRIEVVFNYEQQYCSVMAFNAPGAEIGHYTILESGVTSAQLAAVTEPLYPQAQRNGGWCYREQGGLPAKYVRISAGGNAPHGLSAMGRYSLIETCG